MGIGNDLAKAFAPNDVAKAIKYLLVTLHMLVQVFFVNKIHYPVIKRATLETDGLDFHAKA